MQGGRADLLTAGAATGSAVGWTGGKAAFIVWGTWNGATVKLQMSPDGTTWIDVDSTTLTANGGLPVETPTVQYRLFMSGAGGSTSLSASLIGLR